MQMSYVRKVSQIQDQFVKALQIHLSQHENGARLTDILTWLAKCLFDKVSMNMTFIFFLIIDKLKFLLFSDATRIKQPYNNGLNIIRKREEKNLERIEENINLIKILGFHFCIPHHRFCCTAKCSTYRF